MKFHLITEQGIVDDMRVESSLITQHGSIQNLRASLTANGVRLYGMGSEDDEEDDSNPVGYSVNGTIAVLSIDGGTRTNANWLTRLCGIPTYDDIKLRFQQAYTDPSVKGVLMAINSPGGEADGTNAMSQFIDNFSRKVKPVMAHTAATCCSAAVWYGTAGQALAADPDANVGSIGAVSVFASQARMLKDAGYDITVTRSGPYKAVPSPLEKLDDKGREVLNEKVQMWHNRFLVGLSGNIGMTSDKINKTIANGKVFTAEQALNLGLVKSLISFEQLIANLNAKFDNSARAPARV
jgi:signal peptide peptidase SppA